MTKSNAQKHLNPNNHQYYTQLCIVPNVDFDLSKLRYRVTITPQKGKAVTVGGGIDAKGFSRKIAVESQDSSVVYELMVNHSPLQQIAGKAYKNTENKYSLFKLNFTTAPTQNKPNHVREIFLDNTEVAWYLVKKDETMGALMNRIYQNPPTAEDWAKLQANNPHLGNPSVMKILHAGQVVVLSNEKGNSSKLKKYKEWAQESENKINELKKDPKFDPLFFATYQELFLQMAEQGNTEVHQDLKPDLGEYFAKNSKADPFLYGLKESGDFAVGVVKEGNKEVLSAYKELVNAMEQERLAKSPLSHRRNFAMFKRHYKPLFDRFEAASNKKLFTFDTGLKTDNLKDLVRKTAFVRGRNYQGGLEAYLKNMEVTGKLSTGLRWGGNGLIAWEVAKAGNNVKDAYAKGDNDFTRRTVIKETLKIEVGLAAGGVTTAGVTYGAGLVLGVAVGAAGLPVIIAVGVVAVGAGLVAGYFGGQLGLTTGDWVSDKIEGFIK